MWEIKRQTSLTPCNSITTTSGKYGSWFLESLPILSFLHRFYQNDCLLSIDEIYGKAITTTHLNIHNKDRFLFLSNQILKLHGLIIISRGASRIKSNNFSSYYLYNLESNHFPLYDIEAISLLIDTRVFKYLGI